MLPCVSSRHPSSRLRCVSLQQRVRGASSVSFRTTSSPGALRAFFILCSQGLSPRGASVLLRECLVVGLTVMLASFFFFYSMNNSLEAFFKTGLTFSWRTPG